MDKPPGVVGKPNSRPVVAGRPPVKPGSTNPQMQIPRPGQAPAGKRPPWYQRRYLVYPKFQTTLILLNSLVTLFLFGLVVFLVIRSHLYLEGLVKQTRLPAQSLFVQLMTQQLRELIIYMTLALTVSVSTTAVFTLLLSHRMAGPMIRLKNYFQQVVKTGEFPEQLRFREGDFFQDLPPAINDAFLSLKKRWHK